MLIKGFIHLSICTGSVKAGDLQLKSGGSLAFSQIIFPDVLIMHSLFKSGGPAESHAFSPKDCKSAVLCGFGPKHLNI